MPIKATTTSISAIEKAADERRTMTYYHNAIII